jgi:biopolymer transport protein TolQ
VTTAANDMSFVSLIMNASFTVKLVMLLLLGASVCSWAFILQRYNAYKLAKATADEFDQHFWSGGDLNNLYQKLSLKNNHQGQEAIFIQGFKEFVRLHKQIQASGEVVLEGVERTMAAAMYKEINKLEQNLPFLATVQSMSPYIGLFGTVWGIMNSFRNLGMVQQATLAMVAPGISEALVATAMGLVAAIPAGIAYNRYLNTVDKLANQYQAFFDEFVNFLRRKVYAKANQTAEVI